jgi:DNA polymerase-3 subunit epsilon
LHVLDQYVSDGVLDENERAALDAMARTCGLAEQVETLHRDYIGVVLAAAARDNVISEGERSLLENLSRLLGTDPLLIPPATAAPTSSKALVPGSKVCFTGDAMLSGEGFGRDELEALAARHGLIPVSSVTKKACDLLVCADLATSSTKAKKATQYGVAMMSIEQFVQVLSLDA